jgi:hypothetical protein
MDADRTTYLYNLKNTFNFCFGTLLNAENPYRNVAATVFYNLKTNNGKIMEIL